MRCDPSTVCSNSPDYSLLHGARGHPQRPRAPTFHMVMDRTKKNIIELTHCTSEEYHALRKLPLILVADNVRSAQNVGSMLRTADAFLLRGMVMTGITATPPSAEISKTALGAEHSVEWSYVADAVEAVAELRRQGMLIYVLEQTHGSVPLQELRLPEPAEAPAGMVLVVGNEVSGVDQRIVDMAHAAVEIPMHGTKHSLNVSVSAGIALWEFYRQLHKYIL